MLPVLLAPQVVETRVNLIFILEHIRIVLEQTIIMLTNHCFVNHHKQSLARICCGAEEPGLSKDKTEKLGAMVDTFMWNDSTDMPCSQDCSVTQRRIQGGFTCMISRARDIQLQ